jgi:hypothetical protein
MKLKLIKKESSLHLEQIPRYCLHFFEPKTDTLHGIDYDVSLNSSTTDKRYWVYNQEVGHDIWDNERHYWI